MIAHLVLFSWPLVVLLLFRKLDAAPAVAIAIVAGYLLLPSRPSYDFPLLPPIDKTLVPALSALVMALAFHGRSAAGPGASILPGWLPRSWVSHLLLVVLITGAFLSALTNGDRLVYGERVLPGVTLYSAFSFVLSAIVVLLPFLLARKFLASDKGQRTLLLVLCVAGLLYSLPALYEIRMSPQLNRIFYDFFPHSWRQHLRGGGYRPIVFLQHGLWLAIFMASAFLAALGLFRASSGPTRMRYLLAAVWLLAVLVLSNSLGALVIAACVAPLILFLPVPVQLLTAAIVASLMMTYPVLRGAGLVPVDRILVWAEKVSVERAGSLRYRFDNEDMLLERANQRPLAGWGGWGRNRVFDETGRDLSTVDGFWVLVIGNFGWLGYVAHFGFLGMPLVLLALRRRSLEVGPATAALSLILAAGMIDLIPNGTRTPVTLLIAGALMGRLEWRGAMAAEPAPASAGDPPRGSGHVRPASGEGRLSPQHGAGYTRQKYLHERPGS